MKPIQKLSPLLALVAMVLVTGCQQEEEITEVKPNTAVFEGTVDPAYVGKWQTSDGKSKYEFLADGRYTQASKVGTPNGVIDSKLEGNWLVKDDRMLFKDQSGNVVPYAAKLSGKSLVLALTGSMKNETRLEKK